MLATLALLAAIAPVLTSPADQRTAEAACNAGRAALAAGQLSEASAAFERALTVWPHMPEAHVGLGHVAMRREQFEVALNAYRAARTAFLALSVESINHGLKRVEEAKRAIENREDEIRQVNDPKTGVDEHHAAYRTRQLEGEIAQLRSLDRPINQPTENAPAEIDFFIGNALFRLARIEEAVAAWEQCAKTDRNYAPVFNNLAVGYFKLKRIPEAREALVRAEAAGIVVDARFKQDLERAAH